MKTGYSIESPEDPLNNIQFLEDKIYEHNSTAIQRHDGSLFSRMVRDENGDLVAGIAGWTWAGVCEITQFWVKEDWRKKGIGSSLLMAAEEEAKNRACSTIMVKSYGFQAPHFYRKHGFAIAHILYDFPVGYNYYILKKGLTGIS